MAGRHRRRRSAPLLLAALGLWGLAAEATGQGSPATDRAALEALYDATGGPNWNDDTSWKTAAPLGDWYGVTTDADGRVTGLDLRRNELSGPIPRELGHLGHLEELRLASNRLTGRVPASLGDLTRLRSLHLDWNELSGPLPRELERLKDLETLSLRGISLRGPVPPWLGNLPHLRNLALSRSELTGPVPPWLAGVASLRSLDLGNNELSGPVPRELERLVNLESLRLADNQLTGPIPAWLGSLTGLRSLDLGWNEWSSGPLPPELGRLVNLESLALREVGARGPLPAWLGGLTSLQRLDLRGNELSGPMLRELGSLTNLRTLQLARNDLTGAIPAELGSLTSLETLDLSHSDLTGPIPAELGSLANLETLDLSHADLTGPIPAELGSLANLETLDLSYNWALSGPLPAGLEQSALEELNIFVTRTCAPAAWGEWLAAVEFWGPACEVGPEVTIDIAVLYTPAAREAAGGAAGIEAEIDLWIAETNEAFAASGVQQRLALVARSEVPYTEANGYRDVRRLADPSDGHLDEAHILRDEAGADLVHLIVSPPYNVCGIAAGIPSVFGLTRMDCGGITFAHELGHNMGLRHDRFRVDVFEGSLSSHPAYGYVNRAVLDGVAPQSRRWTTIMSYSEHCRLADVTCSRLPRFSNPRQRHDGDVLGVPFGTGSGLTGASDAVAVLEAMGPAVAAWRDRPADAVNRPPVTAGALPDRRLESAGAVLQVDVSQAFADPEGEPLTYTASSSAPWRVRAQAAGAVVTLTGAGEGAATIRVAATDPGGLSVSRSFAATVDGPADTDPQDSAESDRSALEALYDAAGGAGWTDSANWMTAAPLGEWYGVTTDPDGRVTGLDLVDNGLAGWLPPELGSLAHLETLRLGFGGLTGPIPPALGNLENLELLELAAMDLTGTIPSALGRLVNLRELDLWGNRLTGSMPAALGSLVNLEGLNVSGNELTGPVPSWLGNLSRLRRLYLDGNDFTDRLPDALGDLVNLERLSVSENELTGPVPSWLGNLSQLRYLYLGGNDLAGRLPNTLGSLANLQHLDLFGNDLAGTIPAALGGLVNLKRLNLAYNWGLSGPLPAGLEQSALERLDVFVTRTCAPAAWGEWLATIEFWGAACGAGPDVTIDIAVVYTPAAREAAGGTAGIEAEIDLWIAETNQAYAASGVYLRLALVERSEVAYTETGGQDVDRLRDPSDGHLDEVHALRDRVGADLVHLIVAESPGRCGRAAGIGSVFGLTVLRCGGIVFAHELGHNLGLRHDRFQVQLSEDGAASHPAYGYVNQEMLGAAAPPSSRWVTIMSYATQCGLADARCAWLPRFSNPRQRYDGDALGVAFGVGSGVTGAADAAAVLNATGPAAAAWRDRPPRRNRAPVAVGTLPDRRLSLDARLDVDVSQAFDDPDGDPLTYAASSSAADVAAVGVAGARVTLTAVGEGTAAIRVTATDPDGLSAAQRFRVTVAASAPFTDDPLRPGVTPIRAVHFTELRTRIDARRAAAGLTPFRWTDPVLRPGVTRVRLAHLLELREALAAVYAASGRPAPRWTDAAPLGGATPIRAAHLTELRAAVLALE